MELFARIRVYVQVSSADKEVWVVEQVASVARAIQMVEANYIEVPMRCLAVILGEKDV